MSQQVVTELVIDSNTAGAAEYERAMDGAAAAAGRGSQSASDYGTAIVAVGVSAAAAVVGVKSMLDYVASVNKGLADMATVAKQAGMSLQDFQSIKVAGNIAGLGDAAFNAGLQKSAALLNDGQRNANSLTKLFAENGDSIRKNNGDLITENQLLAQSANYIRNAATEQDKIKIAEMLGFTREWVPFLEQGADAIGRTAQEAIAAGAVIDGEIVKKAQEFDTEWRKSSVLFSATMKAALIDLLPYVDDLIQRAVVFVNELKKARPEGAPPSPFLDDSNPVDRVVRNAVRGGLNAVGINPDAGIEIKLAPEVTEGWSNFTGVLQQKFNDLQNNASDEMKQRIEELDAWWRNKALDPAFVANAVPRMLNMATNGAFPAVPVGVSTFAAPALPYPKSDDPMQAASMPKSGPNTFAELQKQKDWADDAAGDAEDSKRTLIPSNAEASDAVDRAIDTLRRHTERQEADTKAAGLGAGALAKFRAEAAETAAVQANGGEITAQQAADFALLKDRAEAAAVALEKAKVATNIKFNRDTAFLSQEDVSIATQLKGLYPNVATALDSAEASQIRFNNAMKEGANAFQSSAAPALLDFEMGTKKGADAVKAFEDQFVKSLLNMINQMIIFAPIARALQSTLTGGLGGLGGMGVTYGEAGTAGSNLFGPVAPSAHGNIFDGGNIIPFARGGVIDGPSIAPMALMGEAGPEAIVPLRRGSDGNLGIASAGGGGSAPNITFNVVEDSSRAGQREQKQGGNGDFEITQFVDAITAKNAANPGSATSQVLDNRKRIASR